jgi:indole-3-glycerol phosphate synthase
LGADCILLIASVLDDNLLESLNKYAKALDLDVLLEVHNEEELGRAMTISDCLIGINNRNLHTFETDLETSIKLVEKIPAGRFVITESGIHTRDDVRRMMEHNILGFLVGESFMASENPGEKLKEIMFGE